MTSEPGVEPVAEQFQFHCCCGAAIETSSLREICWRCGKTVELIRCEPTPGGKKYKLRISRHRQRESVPSVWPQAFPVAPRTKEPRRRELFTPAVLSAAAQPVRQRSHRPGDRNNRFTLIGLLILLAPVYIPVLLICINFVAAVPEQDRSQELVIQAPRPTDCGLFSDCHYEKRIVHGNSKTSGPYTIIEWKRVDD